MTTFGYWLLVSVHVFCVLFIILPFLEPSTWYHGWGINNLRAKHQRRECEDRGERVSRVNRVERVSRVNRVVERVSRVNK